MRLFVIALVCMSTSAHAQNLSLQLPNSNTSYQSDKFRAGDLDCQNAIGSATNLEFGVTAVRPDGNSYNQFDNYDGGNVGVFARITIPLGKRVKNRINCNELYELELRKKRLEVMRLELQIEQLRRVELEFEE